MLYIFIAILIPLIYSYIRFLWKLVTAPDFFIIIIIAAAGADMFSMYMEASMAGKIAWGLMFTLVLASVYYSALVSLFRRFPSFSHLLNFLTIYSSGFYLLSTITKGGEYLVPKLPSLSSNPNTNWILYTLLAILFFGACWMLRMKGLEDWTRETTETLPSDAKV